MQPIASRDNQYLKLARSLKSAKGRADSGCFLLEGARLAEEALSAAWPLSYALVSEDAAEQPRCAAILQALDERGLPVYALPERLLQQTADTEHSQGLLLIAHLPQSPPALPPTASFVLVADRLADPGNLGAIMRTAWAAGVEALLLTPGSADPFNPKAARASMGALLRLPVLRFAEDAALLALLRERGLALLAAAAQGACRYDQADLRQPLAWLFGAEAHGLSEFWLRAADQQVYLPMAGGAESLNVAAAAAVLLYQTALQREFWALKLSPDRE